MTPRRVNTRRVTQLVWMPSKIEVQETDTYEDMEIPEDEEGHLFEQTRVLSTETEVLRSMLEPPGFYIRITHPPGLPEKAIPAAIKSEVMYAFIDMREEILKHPFQEQLGEALSALLVELAKKK